MSLGAAARLVRWLGPWAGERVPPGIRREELRLDGGRLRCFLYEGPRPPTGAWLVTPGLHPQGPLDPRLDRFCRVLAAAGSLVLAPALPDHLALRLAQAAADDLALAFDELARRSPRPAVFSISFGSGPAIALAARDGYRDRLAALVLFGGFADIADAARFALAGARHDPTNGPAVMLNLVEHLPPRCGVDRVAAAWRAMVARTWGRPELKLPGARDPLAHELAAALGAAERDLFLEGCLLKPGALARLEEGLRASSAAFAFADPRPALAALRCPVVIVHGRDDDVIPVDHAMRLFAGLPENHPAQLHLTGMYGHTGAAFPSPRALFAEARTLLRVAFALARAPMKDGLQLAARGLR